MKKAIFLVDKYTIQGYSKNVLENIFNHYE